MAHTQEQLECGTITGITGLWYTQGEVRDPVANHASHPSTSANHMFEKCQHPSQINTAQK